MILGLEEGVNFPRSWEGPEDDKAKEQLHLSLAESSGLHYGYKSIPAGFQGVSLGCQVPLYQIPAGIQGLPAHGVL